MTEEVMGTIINNLLFVLFVLILLMLIVGVVGIMMFLIKTWIIDWRSE